MLNLKTLGVVIDIGSNTILMLTRYWESGKWKEENHIRFAKLAEKINCENKIIPAAIERATKIIREYKSIIDLLKKNHPDKNLCLQAVATSALREAENRVQVVEAMESILGHPVVVISADQEARLTYRGTVSDFEGAADQPIVLDIGGGSTELMLEKHGTLFSRSYPIGAVRFRDHFKLGSLVRKETVGVIRDEMDRIIDQDYPTFMDETQSRLLVGVAGIPTTLAVIKYHGGEEGYAGVHLKKLTVADLDYYEDLFCRLTPDQMLAQKLVDRYRAEIMAVSCIILKKMMVKFNFTELVVSIKGLRYGFWSEWESVV